MASGAAPGTAGRGTATLAAEVSCRERIVENAHEGEGGRRPSGDPGSSGNDEALRHTVVGSIAVTGQDRAGVSRWWSTVHSVHGSMHRADMQTSAVRRVNSDKNGKDGLLAAGLYRRFGRACPERRRSEAV